MINVSIPYEKLYVIYANYISSLFQTHNLNYKLPSTKTEQNEICNNNEIELNNINKHTFNFLSLDLFS